MLFEKRNIDPENNASDSTDKFKGKEVTIPGTFKRPAFGGSGNPCGSTALGGSHDPDRS